MNETEPTRQLPQVEDEGGTYWFTDSQLLTMQSHRPPFWKHNWGLIAFLALLVTANFIPLGFAVVPFSLALVGCVVTNLLLATLAIQESEEGRYRRSLRLANLGLLLGKITGNLWFSEVIFEQIRAIVFARQGRVVEAQLAYARWPLSNHRSFADTTLANLMCRGLHFGAAAEIYQRRYEEAQKKESRLIKAIVANNLGFSYLLLGKPLIADRYLKEANEKCHSKNFGLRVNILTNMGRTDIQLGNLDAAEERLATVLKLIETRHQYMGQVVGETQLGMAELRYLQNRLDEALLHIKSSTEYYHSVGVGDPLRHYVIMLHSQILKELGRDEEALKISQAFEVEQMSIELENDALFMRASEILNSGDKARLRRLTCDDIH